MGVDRSLPGNSHQRTVFRIMLIMVALLIGAAIGWAFERARQREDSAAAASSAALRTKPSLISVRGFDMVELERQLTAAMQSLNNANECKVALAAEVVRLGDLQAIHALTTDALVQVTSALRELQVATEETNAGSENRIYPRDAEARPLMKLG
jgi:hypothetical protein